MIYLLDAQAEIKDAVRAVFLSVGSTNFRNELAEAIAYFSRAALQQILL